jgi:hypothetical protein
MCRSSSSEVGPKPAGNIPVFLSATNQRTRRRLVERAAGWMPVAGVQDLTAGWRALQELAAHHGRKEPFSVILRANVFHSAKPFEGDGRRPYHGSVGQILDDLAAHAALGFIDEVLLDLTPTVWDAKQMVDVAAGIFTAARSAEI